MKELKIARVIAVIMAGVMTVYFATREDVRTFDNMFLIPDITFPLVLLAGAFLSQRYAVPVLLAGFSMEAGVILVSFFKHLVGGRFDIANFIIVIVAAAMAIVLIRRVARNTK